MTLKYLFLLFVICKPDFETVYETMGKDIAPGIIIITFVTPQ